MTPDQVRRVRDSFALLAPGADEAAAAFYRRLFARDPALRALFPADLAAQRRKLVAALAMAIGALDRPTALAPALEALGRRHAGYGVEDGHYATVGAALLATLKDQLGPRFDAETRAAWTACYGLIAGVMRTGARRAAHGSTKDAGSWDGPSAAAG
jgi:nitric oxide dioxygenase